MGRVFFNRGAVVAWAWLAILWALAAPTLARADARPAVVVLYSANRVLPANVDADRGMREAGPGDSDFFTEFLDAPDFEGEAHERRMAAYLKDKYAGRHVKALVVGGQVALDFMVRHRDRMFPGVPVVHMGVSRAALAARPLPHDVVGTPVAHDFLGTMRLALQLQPATRRIVVVTGSSVWDRTRAQEARDAAAALGAPVAVEHLHALPEAALLARLGQLDRHTVVVTPSYYRDGAGQNTAPIDAIARIASASSAPVYSIFATHLGTGVVGGRMSSFTDLGRQARETVDRLVAGEPVTAIAAHAAAPTPAHLDWRQVRRWEIDEDRVPADAVAVHRSPTFWEAYRGRILVAAAVMAVQAALIVALLVERRQRRRVARQLVDSERRMRLAADAAQLSVFAWDIAAPPGAAGVPFDDVLAAVHPADRARVEDAVRGAVAGATQFEVEHRLLRADGGIDWRAARGQAVRENGSRVIGVSMDITGRKQAESQAAADRAALTHLSRASTMGQLSAAIAHELNQPLAAILGNAEVALKLLDRPGSSLDEIKEILGDVIADNHRAADVIRRLSALYRRGETGPGQIDLAALVRETVDLLRAELLLRQVAVQVDVTAPDAVVHGSRVQVQQVLINLIVNAADAMAAVPPERRRVAIEVQARDGVAEVRVRDAGPGIAAEHLAHLFDPFWSTKPSGLGIGLTICKSIVEAHGGRLEAATHPGGGAVFRVALPAAGAAPTQKAPHVPHLSH